jgi:FtsP/CotA-like multicopper oxidase with cupredoxin domain
VIANIAAGTVSRGAVRPAVVKAVPPPQRFVGLAKEPVTRTRRLFFSETETQYFITVDGETPAVFSPDNPPGIIATQGDVEDWIIENRTGENHAFHLHQLHFLVVSQNNFEVNGSRPVAAIQGQVLDMIDVPYWDGDPSHPYPSVTLRVDFRGPVAGDFVYHCHILEHEDGGMMGIIRVLPPAVQRTSRK